MIDTIRLKVPLTPLILLAIQKKSTQQVISNIGYGTKYYAPLLIPPFDEQLTIIKDFDYPGRMNMYFYIEGSLPRVALGDNVRLLHPSSLPFLLKRIEKAFIEQYNDVVSWEAWEVQRLDLVYAWKYATVTEALQALGFVKTQQYLLKNRHIYKETMTFGGRSFSATFYLKEFEFMKKGYKELVNKGEQGKADEILNISKNLLRFETRLHKSKLSTLLKKKVIFCKDLIELDESWYYEILNKCLKDIFKNSNGYEMADNESWEKLRIAYPKAKAVRLFLFWKVYYLNEEHIKPLLKSMFHSTSMLRNFTDLSKAGVGLPKITDTHSIDFSVPNATAPVALATESI